MGFKSTWSKFVLMEPVFAGIFLLKTIWQYLNFSTDFWLWAIDLKLKITNDISNIFFMFKDLP